MYVTVPASARGALSQIETELGLPRARAARLMPFGPKGLCYWNCDRYVAQRGGKVVYGWQVQGVSNLFIRLMHHAVVRTAAGRLIDPTEMNGKTTGETTIILDDSRKPPRDYPAFYPNKYFELHGGRDALQRCRDAEEHQLGLYRDAMARAREFGIPWVPGEGLDLARLPNAEALMFQLEHARDAVDQAIAFSIAARDAAALGG